MQGMQTVLQLVKAINNSGISLVVDTENKRIGFQCNETAAWNDLPEHARRTGQYIWLNTDWR